jgi:hypothetical protein
MEGAMNIRVHELQEAAKNWRENLSQRLYGKTARVFFRGNMVPWKTIYTVIAHSESYNWENMAGNLIGYLESEVSSYRSKVITWEERDAIDEVLAFNEDDLVAARDKLLETLGMEVETFAWRYKSEH